MAVLSDFVTKAIKTLKTNSPEILTALGVSGVVTTAYLAGKASYRASRMIETYEAAGGMSDDRKQRFKEQTKLTWKLYIPAGISGTVTIGCIIAGSRSSGRRTAAAVTAYSLTERAFSEYKEKVIQEVGKTKEQKLKDTLAQDRINADPVGGREVLVVGKGNILCYDQRSCRYFRSSMEELKRAENDINFQINHERFVSLSEFYIAIGLPITHESVYNGWDLNRGLMELDITTTLSEKDEPCLSVDFNYVQPIHDRDIRGDSLE